MRTVIVILIKGAYSRYLKLRKIACWKENSQQLYDDILKVEMLFQYNATITLSASY